MRRLLLPVVAVSSSLCVIESAHALDFGYSHTYEDFSKRNADQIGISHTFDNNIVIGVEARAVASTYSDGKAGKAFSHDEIREYHYKIKYRYKATPKLEIVPEFGWDHYYQSERYKTRVSLAYKINPQFRVYSKYRYDYFDFEQSRTGRNLGIYGIELGVNQTWNKFGFTYGYDQYFADYSNIYANRNTDFKVKFATEYRFTDKFAPYFEIRNESFRNTSTQRQTNVEVGFNYKFF